VTEEQRRGEERAPSSARGNADTSGRPSCSDQSTQPRGSDLARAALRAAREAAKTSRTAAGTPRRRTVTGGTGSRRRRRWSGAGPDDRDPQPLGRLAARLATDRGWAERLAGGHVFGRWATLVGEDVAEHATPVALDGGVLTVQAASTAWATQLRLLQHQLLAKISAGVGKGVVTRIKVQGPAAPSWRYGPRHVSGRGPRDTYG
jgi:predicted nucleic acid-binding Zn ribbon protein